MKDILPLGSIVLLPLNVKAMIIGYLPSKINDEIFYDYVCTNINGLDKDFKDLKNKRDYFYILKERIEKVLFFGYQDQVFFDYAKNIEKISHDINRQRKLTNNNVSNEAISKIYSSLIKEKENG